MPVRFLTAALVSAALLTAAVSTRAGEGPACTRDPKLVKKAYPVADLIANLPQGAPSAAVPSPVPEPGAQAACRAGANVELCSSGQDQLMRLLCNVIEPASWSVRGGPGSVEYFAPTSSLVVSQTAKIQEAVAGVLASLREQLHTQVAVEARFLTLSDEGLERVGRDIHLKTVDGGVPVAFLSAGQLSHLMETAQADDRCNVLAAPKITMLNGQASSISVGETRMFVTGLTVKAADEGFVYTPVVEPVSTGLSLAFQPFVSADGRLINLYVKAKVTSLDTEEVQYVPLVIPNGAGTAESAPFTQLLQMPRSTTLTADRPLALPDGGTALFVVGKRPCEVVERSKVPMLGDLPIVGELFSKVHRRPEVENVVMVVTPRLILDENEEAEACTKDGTCCHDRKTVAVPPPAIVEGQTGSPVFGSGLKAVKDARVGGITLPEGPSQTACAAPCCKDAACAAPCCKDCPTAKAGAPAVEEILLRAKMLAIRMKRPVGVYIDGNGQASEVILAEEAGSTPASVAQPRSGISCPAGSCCSAPCCKDCPAAATAAAGTDAKPAPRTAERVVRAEVVQIAHTQGDGVGFGRIEIAASEKRVSVSNNRFEATADRFTMTGKDEISLQGNVRLIWKGKSGPNEVRVDRADIQAKDGLMQIRLGD